MSEALEISLAGSVVPRIGFAGLHVAGPGGWGAPADRAAAKELLRAAVEVGVRYIDTADTLGPGTSEESIREALHPYADGIVIGTKAGMTRAGPRDWGVLGRPDYLKQQAITSLYRLRLDRIPLFTLHRVDPSYPLADQVGALVELREQGVIQHIGLCGVTPEQLDEAVAITPNRLGSEPLQPREPSTRSNAGSGRGARHPLHRVLGHRSRPGPRGRTPVRAVAERLDATPAQVLIAWLLQRSPNVISIPGTGNPEHLRSNFAASQLHFDADALAALDAFAAQTRPIPDVPTSPLTPDRTTPAQTQEKEGCNEIDYPTRGHSLAVASAAALLAGCAATPGSADDPFVFLSDLEPVCFDTGGYRNLANYNVSRQILEPLVHQAQDGSYSPGLAQSWEVSEDGLTWTLHLRDDVTFHDGTTLDANDVQASADRFFVEGNTLSGPNWLIDGNYDVVDDFTWEVTLDSPQANFLQSASTPDFPVLSSESIEEFTDGDRCADPTKLVGAGPFIPTTYVKGESLTLERFEDYHTGPTAGPAKLAAVEIRFVPEAQARIGALQSGQADAASAVPPLNAADLETAGFTLETAPATGVPYVATLNTASGPTADVLVGDALFRGADLDAIIDNVYAGRYDRAWTVLAPATPPIGSYNEDIAGSIAYDPGAATASLAEAGYTTKNADGILVNAAGEPLVLRWIFDGGDIRDQRDVLAEAIQADVREIGIDIQIEKLDTSAYLARIDEGTFEIAAESWGQSDAFILLTVAGPIVNYPKYEDDEVTGWLFEAWATLDDDAHRAELYQNIQQRLSDNRVVLPLYVQNFIVALGPDYTGIEFDPVGFPTAFTNVERVAG